MNSRALFKILYLFYLIAFLLVIIPPIFNIYPSPALHPSQSYSHTDFYDICYYTLNKDDNYGPWRDVYPPLGHLYCYFSSFFMPHLSDMRFYSRYAWPDPIPLLILIVLSIYSNFFLYFSIRRKFNFECPVYIILANSTTTPFLYLYDRANLMMIGYIFFNFAFAYLLISGFTSRFFSILVSIGVGLKPYLAFPLIFFPLTFLRSLFFAFILNIFSFLIWKPPAINLLYDNLTRFASEDITRDLNLQNIIWSSAAWTSYLRYFQFLSQINPSSPLSSIEIHIAHISLYIGLVISSVSLFLIFILLFLIFAKKLSISDFSSRNQFALSNIYIFSASYIGLFAFMVNMSKSIYWYSLVFIMPALILIDYLIYNAIITPHPKSVFFIFCSCSYAFLKVITLNIFFISSFKHCDTLPSFILYWQDLFGGFLFNNSLPAMCYVPSFFSIGFLALRAFLIPPLCLFAILALFLSLSQLRKSYSLLC